MKKILSFVLFVFSFSLFGLNIQNSSSLKSILEIVKENSKETKRYFDYDENNVLFDNAKDCINVDSQYVFNFLLTIIDTAFEDRSLFVQNKSLYDLALVDWKKVIGNKPYKYCKLSYPDMYGTTEHYIFLNESYKVRFVEAWED